MNLLDNYIVFKDVNGLVHRISRILWWFVVSYELSDSILITVIVVLYELILINTNIMKII